MGKPRKQGECITKQYNNIHVCYKPLGETITGSRRRISASDDIVRDITSTVPRLVPTHRHGHVDSSVHNHKQLLQSTTTLLRKFKRLKLIWQSISELRSVTCHMGSHTVTQNRRKRYALSQPDLPTQEE